MKIIRELRAFMCEARMRWNKESEQQKLIGILIKQNNQLMDRFMASNFEELKIYNTDGVDVFNSSEPGPLGPEFDENNAGEVIDLDEMATSSRK